MSTSKVLPSRLLTVHEELDQTFENHVIQAHDSSILHTLIKAHALCTPQQVLPGVPSIGLCTEGQRVELVAEEREVLAICDHCLGHKRPGHILVAPEALVHGLRSCPCKETGEAISPQEDLNLVGQLAFAHFISAVPVWDHVELCVAVTAWVRDLGTCKDGIGVLPSE